MATRQIDYARELNAAQYQAVTARDGPILVVAGAGSGKTRTLVYRVAWLVEQGVDPGAILLLTFTRRAATEMIARAASMLVVPAVVNSPRKTIPSGRFAPRMPCEAAINPPTLSPTTRRKEATNRMLVT